jgi:hypothetical protein
MEKVSRRPSLKDTLESFLHIEVSLRDTEENERGLKHFNQTLCVEIFGTLCRQP